MGVTFPERRVDSRCKGEPCRGDLDMGVGPVVNEVFPQVEVSQVVQAFGQGCQREPRPEKEQSFHKTFTARHRDALKCLPRARANDLLDLPGRRLQHQVDRLVECSDDEHDRVDALDVMQEDQC